MVGGSPEQNESSTGTETVPSRVKRLWKVRVRHPRRVCNVREPHPRIWDFPTNSLEGTHTSVAFVTATTDGVG